MRILSIVCFLLLGCLKTGWGQITLTAGDYPEAMVGIDSLKRTVHNSSFPSLSTGSGTYWDLSSLTDSIPVFFSYRVPGFTHQYADSNYYNLGAYVFQGNTERSIISTGLLEHGVNIREALYSLTSLTGGGTDSLFISQQYCSYSTPLPKIAFDISYGSHWESLSYFDLPYSLSISMVSLSHAPCLRRRYISVSDTVTGWGFMRVKNFLGGPSGLFEVLQVKEMTISTDSFFINGAPASASDLMIFNLNQAHKDTIREQNYYRIGEVTPLAKVAFRDDAFTQPYKATTHMQRLLPIKVDMPAAVTPANVFPNPATHTISIDMPGNALNCIVDFVDVNGKVALTTKLSSGQSTIEIPASIPSGHYYLKFVTEKGDICTRPIDISR